MLTSMFGSVELWKSIIDGIGLSICCLTTLYVFRKKTGKISRNKDERNKERFEQEVFCQMVRQQFETSIAAIADAVNNEKNSLKTLVYECMPEKNIKTNKTMETNAPCGSMSYKKPYEEVIRLKQLGLNAGGISEKLQLQQEEIELISKFKKQKENNRLIGYSF